MRTGEVNFSHNKSTFMGSAMLMSNASDIVVSERKSVEEHDKNKTTAMKIKKKLMKHTVSSTVKGRQLVQENDSIGQMIRSISPTRFMPVNPSQAKNIILRPIKYEPQNTPKKEKNETAAEEDFSNNFPSNVLRRAKHSSLNRPMIIHGGVT